MHYRLIKPIWGKRTLRNGELNPDFIEEVSGPDTIEGADLAPSFLRSKNDEGYNVYYFPNHPKEVDDSVKHLSGSHIDQFNYVFVDMDLKDEEYANKDEFLETIINFTPTPTKVVDSGHGIHAYWAVDDLSRNAFCLIQMALLQHLRTDVSVYTTLQLMRLEGYNNTKNHNNYIPCRVLDAYSSHKSYVVNDFIPYIEAITEDNKNRVRRHLDGLDGKVSNDFVQDIDSTKIPPRFLKLLETNKWISDRFTNPQEYGDRSSVDMSLTNVLFKERFTYGEAVSIISNTQKALEKGIHGKEYAELTVGKVYSDSPTHNIESASDFLRRSGSEIKAQQVYGPSYMDTAVLVEPWRKKELTGLIAGSGVGKTSTTLNIIKEMLNNTPNSNDAYVFVSLEMSKQQIISRWIELVGDSPHILDRLYVLDATTRDGMPLIIGLQEIYGYCNELKQVTGRGIGSIAIDHLGIISTHIDTRVDPTFSIESDQGTGYGEVRNLTPNRLATELKALVKMLDCHGIILTQTTKAKGVGDMPIGKDGAYGISQYEWIMDRIITVWQPLMRVQHLCETKFTAWQYVKIREKRHEDKITEGVAKLLAFNLKDGSLRPINNMEYDEFLEYIALADEARKVAETNKTSSYTHNFEDEFDDILGA